MSVAVAVNSPIGADPAAGRDSTQSTLEISGSLTLTGNYGGASSHGDTMNLAGFCSSDYAPKDVEIWQEPTSGNPPVIYQFLYGRGTTQANGVLIVTLATLVEITQAAAYPAALTSTDVPPNIRFKASFCKNI